METRWSELELLVTEIGDELEGAAKGGDEAAENILGRDVTALDLGNPGDRHAHPDSNLLLRQASPLAHLSQPPTARIIEHRGHGGIETVATATDISGSGGRCA